MSATPLPDPAETARLFAVVAERSSKLMGDYLERHARGKGVSYSDEFGIAKAFMDLSAQMLANPWKLAETQMKMFWDYTALWQSSVLRMTIALSMSLMTVIMPHALVRVLN